MKNTKWRWVEIRSACIKTIEQLKSLEQSTSDGAVCTITVYIQVLFEDISFLLRFQY